MKGPTRAVLWAGVIAYFAAVLLWLGRDPRLSREVFPQGSVFNTSPRGLSLAFHYLRERPGAPRRVAVLRRPIRAGEIEPDAVVLRVRPQSAPGPLLTPGEQAWLHGGGRLVLGLAGRYGPTAVEEARDGVVRKVFPIWPGVNRFQPAVLRVLADGVPGDTHALLALGSRAMLSRWRLGSGDVLFLSIPEVLENADLGLGDHLRLLEALSGRSRPVYFDERAHGQERDMGVLDLMTAWGLGPFLIVLTLAGLMAFWRERVRIGPPQDEYRERRSEAVDLLDSLAQLYDRGLGNGQALRLYRQGLARAIAWRTGLKGEALAKRVTDLAGVAWAKTPPQGDLDPGAFQRTLHAVNDGYRRLDARSR